MSRPDISESKLRSDPFVSCLRDLMAEIQTHGADAGKIKVPKIETYHLRDELIETMQANKGTVTIKVFADLVSKYFGKFLKKKGKFKGKAMGMAASIGGVDPRTEAGQKWWVDGCGGDPNAPFINEYIPAFSPGGGWVNESGENTKPGETLYFQDLLQCLGMATAPYIPDLSGSAQLKKKKKKKKKSKKLSRALSKKSKKLSRALSKKLSRALRKKVKKNKSKKSRR